MADMLVTPQELASFMQVDYTGLTAAQQTTMTLIVSLATGKIQAAAGQRLVAATSTFQIDVDICEFSPWLALPQMPVRSVSSVLIDGVAVTDWYLRSQRLWRLAGWNTNRSAPAQIKVVAAHGYPDGSQFLQAARDMCLALAAAGYGNPQAVSSEQIDDYRVSYADANARMQVTDASRDLLRETYGMSAYVTG